jgi:hypothetical protein
LRRDTEISPHEIPAKETHLNLSHDFKWPSKEEMVSVYNTPLKSVLSVFVECHHEALGPPIYAQDSKLPLEHRLTFGTAQINVELLRTITKLQTCFRKEFNTSSLASFFVCVKMIVLPWAPQYT